ncbi:hypothetical protein M422DRAFT_65705 [Sphaerobolus stellatus SS14]|nr:hypothetical protein M422DRAFT_65705 [Sphaerobolus stellatus SS14]
MASENPLIQQVLETLPAILAGVTATKYLTAAGYVVLLYDHLLLLEEEVHLIWSARWSWLKLLFFYNRYTVPIFMGICMYVLSGISTVGLSTESCRDWVGSATFLSVAGLAIANVFVVQRVWALWGGQKKILLICSAMLIATYIGTFIAISFAVKMVLPEVSYNPVIKSCVISQRPRLYIVGFTIPLAFEGFLFILICWHSAQQRPGYLHTKLVKQLYLDGFVYFFALTALRIFNIIVMSVAPLQYVLLGDFFIWSMITTLINRMLITITSDVEMPPESLSTSHTPDPNQTYGQSQVYSKVSGTVTPSAYEPRSPDTVIELKPIVASKGKGQDPVSSSEPSPQYFGKDGYGELQENRYGRLPGPYLQPASDTRIQARESSVFQNFMDMDDDAEASSSKPLWKKGSSSRADSQRTYVWE